MPAPQYLTGYKVSADTRFVQNGPARDGWTPAARGRGVPAPEEEPTIGLPGGQQPTGQAPAGGGRRGAGAQ